MAMREGAAVTSVSDAGRDSRGGCGGSCEADPLLPQKDKLAKPRTMYEGRSTILRVFGLNEVHGSMGSELMISFVFTEHLIRGALFEFAYPAERFLFQSYGVRGPTIQVLGSISGLPWAIKPLLGLISDLLPICGYQKAPYMLITSAGAAVAYACLGFMSPDILTEWWAVLCLFVALMQVAFVDVLMEAKYAEKIRESPHAGPSIMTFIWAGICFCGCVATFSSGLVIQHYGPKRVYMLCIVPALIGMLPIAAGYLREHHLAGEELWRLRAFFWLQKEIIAAGFMLFISAVILTATCVAGCSHGTTLAVGLFLLVAMSLTMLLVLTPPIGRFAIFSLLQAAFLWPTDGAGLYFFTDSLEQFPTGPHFSKFFMVTILGSFGHALSFIGVVLYMKHMSRWRYRNLLIMANVLCSLVHQADILIYSRSNAALGIPDWAFMLGSSAMRNILNQWLWLPQVLIFSFLCPKGMEATMFALLAGCHNIGLCIASVSGAWLLSTLGVEPNGSPVESAQFDNLWKASFVSSLLPFLSICLLFNLIPDVDQQSEPLDSTQHSATSGSPLRRLLGDDAAPPPTLPLSSPSSSRSP